jgi:hypothetical protein
LRSMAYGGHPQHHSRLVTLEETAVEKRTLDHFKHARG